MINIKELDKKGVSEEKDWRQKSESERDRDKEKNRRKSVGINIGTWDTRGKEREER